jgi:hypothetical protein
MGYYKDLTIDVWLSEIKRLIIFLRILHFEGIQ